MISTRNNMKSSTLFSSFVLCASIGSVFGEHGGKHRRDCVKRTPKEKSIMLVNLKTIKTDGTAVAFIESGVCPVQIPAGDATFEEDNKHHQTYKITLGNGAKCAVEGWDTGPTTMECAKDGVDDKIERTWEDALYEAQPCPKGCDAECKAIDPKWNVNALKMFAFKRLMLFGFTNNHQWEEQPKGKKPQSSVISTATATAAATAAATSTASTGKIRRTVQFQ